MSASNYYEGMSISEKEIARSNRFTSLCHTVVVSLISLAYMLEFVKGSRSLFYVLLTILLGFIAPTLEFILLKKNKCSPAIKHLVSFGFGIFYTFLCLTTVNALCFVYVLPMLVVITCYNDYKCSLKVSLSAWLVNIIQIICFLVQGVYTLEKDSASIEIQILVVFVVALYTTLTSKTLCQNNDGRMQQIQNQGDQTEKLLQDTLSTSTNMVQDINTLHTKIDVLNEKIDSTKNAMGEVNSGTTDTAFAVQKQLELTENIQTKVDGVEYGTKQILTSVSLANQAIDAGSQHIEHLVEQVHQSVDSGKQVTLELKELNNDMKQLSSVVDIINSISSETGLLALNASIEAARAGDAGRGFAVVASEISKMASDTEQATGQIKEMLDSISNTIYRVVTVTTAMIDMIESQNEITQNTAQSFQDIEHNTETISEYTNNLNTYVAELAKANNEITDSISTISAITEEVAAHANETYSISEENIETVQSVVQLADHLKDLATQLNQ